jgi:hypothetical protein
VKLPLRKGISDMLTTGTSRRKVVLVVCLLGLALAGCGSGGGVLVGPPSTPTHAPYHLDASVRRQCSWQNNGPATCAVYITNQADSNFTFNWQATSSPGGAIFSPDSGSLAPGETSDMITVISPTTICPITFRFVDSQTQLEADSQFNPCDG